MKLSKISVILDLALITMATILWFMAVFSDDVAKIARIATTFSLCTYFVGLRILLEIKKHKL